MPSDRKRDSDELHDRHDGSDNPFTAFQRFVDEQVSSMLQAFVGLPSSTVQMRPWRPWNEKEGKDHESWGWRPAGHGEEGEMGEDERKAESDGTQSRWTSQSWSWSFPNAEQDGAGAGAGLDDHDGISPPHTHHHPVPTLGAMRLAHFLRNSPYSPTNLESDADLQAFGPFWRQAFSDLMDATEGKSLANERRLDASSSLPREEWARQFLRKWSHNYQEKALQREGSMPAWGEIGLLGLGLGAFEELRSTMKSKEDEIERELSRWLDGAEDEHSRAEAEDDGWAGATELDVYERMLDGGGRASEGVQASSAEQAQARAAAQPSIVATMTTSQRVTLPDGSVRTRRVLKKRFADGREESSETEELEAARDSSLVPGNNLAAALQQPDEAPHDGSSSSSSSSSRMPETGTRAERRGGGGWFWSQADR